MGGASSVNVSFQYGTTTGYGNTAAPVALMAPGQFHAVPTNLVANTTYHFRAVATNTSGTVYGEDRSFATLASPTGFTVTTGQATDISTMVTGGISVSLNGSIPSLGNVTAATVSFQWGPTAAYESGTTPAIQINGRLVTSNVMNTTGSFQAAVIDLPANATYHYRAMAMGGSSVIYGSDVTFTTNPAPRPPDQSVQNLSVQDAHTVYYANKPSNANFLVIDCRPYVKTDEHLQYVDLTISPT
jgi:hypothetical protein